MATAVLENPRRTEPKPHDGFEKMLVNGHWRQGSGALTEDLLIAPDTVAVQLASAVRPSWVEQPLMCLRFLLVANAGMSFEPLPVEDRKFPPTVTNHACFL